MSKLTFPIRSDKLQYEVAYKNHVSYLKTDFQQIDIYDTYAFGKVLLLDGHVQLAELDEHCYHEAPLPAVQIARIYGGRELCQMELRRTGTRSFRLDLL